MTNPVLPTSLQMLTRCWLMRKAQLKSARTAIDCAQQALQASWRQLRHAQKQHQRALRMLTRPHGVSSLSGHDARFWQASAKALAHAVNAEHVRLEAGQRQLAVCVVELARSRAGCVLALKALRYERRLYAAPDRAACLQERRRAR